MLADEDLTRWFLAHGADPNAESHHGLTPLLKAVQERPLATVRLLHEAGAYLAIAVPFVCSARATQDGETESDGAARRLEVLRYLLDNGADPEAPMWFVSPFSFSYIQSPAFCLMRNLEWRCGILRQSSNEKVMFREQRLQEMPKRLVRRNIVSVKLLMQYTGHTIDTAVATTLTMALVSTVPLSSAPKTWPRSYCVVERGPTPRR